VEEITAFVGANSLAYLPLEDLVASTGRPASDYCLACFDGDYPIEIPAMTRQGKLRLESGS